ncbi:hypothetical protein [Pararhizobium arenae]|uniref:hypothetical protein n=1 Tax=Pararhizobium arenae TaxID=1856850 RepID=UPI00117AAB78|nr:hypothetical protein [Pararhizobium arenae]
MDFSPRAGAAALGITEQQFAEYQHGNPPRHIELACAALYHRLDPWEKTNAAKHVNKAMKLLKPEKIAGLIIKPLAGVIE